MSKTSLNLSLDSAYKYVDKNVICIKTAVINLCADIDRYFRVRLNVNISKEVKEYSFYEIKRTFPSLSKMTLEQFNRLLLLVVNIHNINAHLHLSKPVFIDEDIEEYLYNILEPDYIVSVNRKLTIYGEAYVLYFLSQKYNLFPFITAFFNIRIIKEFSSFTGQEITNYQYETQHIVQQYCGLGKPVYPEITDKFDYQFMNNMFRKHMTKVIFDLEKTCSNRTKAHSTSSCIATVLRNSYAFDNDEETLDLIVFLRNSWLHGTAIDDVVDKNGEKIKFTYEFIFKSFIQIKKCLLNSFKDFDIVLKDLNEFATSYLSFYVLRLIEVSYKVLDKRLLTEDKVESRIKNLDFAYDRIQKANVKFYNLVSELIDPDDIHFKISGSKLQDSTTRFFNTQDIKVIQLSSNTGFDIGNYHTNAKQLVLVALNIDEENMNYINGKNINEYLLTECKSFGDRIRVYETINITERGNGDASKFEFKSF